MKEKVLYATVSPHYSVDGVIPTNKNNLFIELLLIFRILSKKILNIDRF